MLSSPKLLCLCPLTESTRMSAPTYKHYDALPMDFAHMLLHPPRGVSEVEVGVLRVAIGTDVNVELLLASLGVDHAWQGGQDERAHPQGVHLCEKQRDGQRMMIIHHFGKETFTPDENPSTFQQLYYFNYK